MSAVAVFGSYMILLPNIIVLYINVRILLLLLYEIDIRTNDDTRTIMTMTTARRDLML